MLRTKVEDGAAYSKLCIAYSLFTSMSWVRALSYLIVPLGMLKLEIFKFCIVTSFLP